jgi:hypothetical protein
VNEIITLIAERPTLYSVNEYFSSRASLKWKYRPATKLPRPTNVPEPTGPNFHSLARIHDHRKSPTTMKVRDPSGATMGSVRRPSILSPSISRKSCACIVVRMTRALQASAMIAVLSRVLVGATGESDMG